ncbi:MAG: Formyl transferase domain protein [Parcubacteria group bacterium GW2011_GWA2_51_10]|nr:MAG: Formyl transferase domain protein [Parcubacteria group bacterium GW2011_GWA2_51_10]
MPTPKLFVLADYPWGVDIVRHLLSRKETIVGAALASPETEGPLNRGCSESLRALLSLPQEQILRADKLESKAGRERVRQIKPDIILSLFWSSILRPDFLALSPDAINIHLSLLPYNRGANPNVWAIVEGTPAGVTMHYMDEGTDTGDIIAQKEVPIESTDTGKSLYQKLTATAVELFKSAWPQVAAGATQRKKQPGGGTAHLRRDYAQLAEIKLDEPTTARKVIDHLRAKTFPPFPGAFFVDDEGKRIQARIELANLDEHEQKN